MFSLNKKQKELYILQLIKTSITSPVTTDIKSVRFQKEQNPLVNLWGYVSQSSDIDVLFLKENMCVFLITSRVGGWLSFPIFISHSDASLWDLQSQYGMVYHLHQSDANPNLDIATYL